MKLSKLYTNLPGKFSPITFIDGLNVILGEVRLPENKDRDTHNLGKTTLGRLLDFCLLSGKDNKFFLHRVVFFEPFVFFLELQLISGEYLTIRRSVAEATRIAFKSHSKPHQDFSQEPDSGWDHIRVPFERARDILDGHLNLTAVKPWTYRKGLGYLLRSQDDYRDVFQLRNFQNAHVDWKPYLAHLLGFNASTIEHHYKINDEIEATETAANAIQRELGGSIEDLSKIEGILLLKQRDLDAKEKLLASFDFRSEDLASTESLVNELDVEVASLNARRYTLGANRKKVVASLEEGRISFDPAEAAKLFTDANVFFAGQLRKDFEQLIAFNQSVARERIAYLREERDDIDNELSSVNARLNELGKRRSEILSFLGSTDAFEKFRIYSNDVIDLRVDVETLKRQRELLHKLQEFRAKVRSLKQTKEALQTDIEADVERQSSTSESLFSTLRVFFSEIIEEVIDRKALLSVSVNASGNPDFYAEILDEQGNTTSAALGHTYRKLLCIAFDMALLRGHLNVNFPRFAFHDGVFESLDDRKKLNLLAAIRSYAALGIQSVVTAIDADLPTSEGVLFHNGEVVLRLHDEGDDGRLFKMPAW